MFERFTDQTRRAVVLAQEQARGLGSGAIGTEHLLLGLLEERGEAAATLESLGVTREAARGAVGEGDRHGAPASDSPPFTAATKRALEEALRQAVARDDDRIRPVDLLLGVVADERCGAVEVLGRLGCSSEAVREAARASRRRDAERAAARPRPGAGGMFVRIHTERCALCRRDLQRVGRHVVVGSVGVCEACVDAARAALDAAGAGQSRIELDPEAGRRPPDV